MPNDDSKSQTEKRVQEAKSNIMQGTIIFVLAIFFGPVILGGFIVTVGMTFMEFYSSPDASTEEIEREIEANTGSLEESVETTVDGGQIVNLLHWHSCTPSEKESILYDVLSNSSLWVSQSELDDELLKDRVRELRETLDSYVEQRESLEKTDPDLMGRPLPEIIDEVLEAHSG